MMDRQHNDNNGQLDHILTEYYVAEDSGASFDWTNAIRENASLAGKIFDFLDNKAAVIDAAIPNVRVRLNGRTYTLSELVGRGGMGVVYKATDEQLRPVAIKRLTHESATALERFKLEARISTQLDHPNIARVSEVGEFAGQHFQRLEFVDGDSLDRTLKRGDVEPRQAVSWCRQIASALHHAHERRIIHRDVKPANIMIETATGRAVLTDFGLAQDLRERSSLTQTGLVPGTPRYLAPEQIDPKLGDVSAQTDIYCLGAVMYELLTGSTAVGVGDANSEWEAVPLPLVSICRKCLQRNPGKRFASAAELAAHLSRIEPQLAESKLRPTSSQPISLWSRAALLGSFAAMAVLVAITLLLDRAHEGPNTPQHKELAQETANEKTPVTSPVQPSVTKLDVTSPRTGESASQPVEDPQRELSADPASIEPTKTVDIQFELLGHQEQLDNHTDDFPTGPIGIDGFEIIDHEFRFRERTGIRGEKYNVFRDEAGRITNVQYIATLHSDSKAATLLGKGKRGAAKGFVKLELRPIR